MNQPAPVSSRANTRRKRLFIIFLLLWTPASIVIGDRWADTVTFRVNDLATIAGAGSIQRDSEGIFYHINPDGRARAVFPELQPPLYAEECLDCRMMTGEQLAQTNEFCAVAVRKDLPLLNFQLPCKTWAVISDGSRVMAFVVFLIPLIAGMLLRWIWRFTSRSGAEET